MFGYLRCRTHLGIRLCIHSGLELYTVFRQFSGLVVSQLAGANATNRRAHPKFYLSWTTSGVIIQSQSRASSHMMLAICSVTLSLRIQPAAGSKAQSLLLMPGTILDTGQQMFCVGCGVIRRLQMDHNQI